MKKEEKPIVKPEEPQVVYVNVYPDGDLYAHHSAEIAHRCLYEGGTTKKFIEVMDEC